MQRFVFSASRNMIQASFIVYTFLFPLAADNYYALPSSLCIFTRIFICFSPDAPLTFFHLSGLT